MFPSIFQVPENDVWKDVRSNGFVDNLDEPAYNFVKAKAVEAVAELLEKRTNANGLVIFIIEYNLLLMLLKIFLLLDIC